MSISILNNLNLNNNQLLNAKLHVLSSDPTANAGKIIYNSTDKVVKYSDGSSWYTLSRKGVFSDLPNLYVGTTQVTSNTDAKNPITAVGFKTTAGTADFLLGDGNTKTLKTLATELQTHLNSVYLQLSGGTMAKTAKIYFGDTSTYFYYDSGTDMFMFSKGIYSTGQVCAGGTGSSSSSGGGTSYDRLDKWSDYSDDKSGYVLSALLGNDLNTRVKTLEGGSAMNITMGTTGSEYAVTKITKSGTTLTCATARFAPLDSNGKVSSAYLPSYVDDVIEGYYYSSKFYSDSAHTTAYTGESGKIYTDLSTNKTYRWGGSAYVEISASLAIGTTAGTAYDGAAGNTLAANLASLTTTVNNIKVYNTTITVSHSVANGASSRNNQTFTLNQSSAKTITVYDTWRPVVDNLTSTVATSSLSAKQGNVLKGLVDAKPAEYRYSIAGSSSNTTRTYTPDQTFNAQPAVSLWDASGNLVLTDIKYDSSTKKLTVSFASAPTQNYTLVAIGN